MRAIVHRSSESSTRSLGALLGMALLLVSGHSDAVGTRRFVLEQSADFKGGDLSGVAIDSSGRVRAGFELGHIAIEQAPVIWSALGRDDKTLLLGTGQEGKILEFRDERVVGQYETGGLVVTSMVEGWGRAVYLSSLPEGKLWKLERGKLTAFARLPEVEHIWQLAFDKRRSVLYAATGPDGKLFRIERDGRSEVLFDAPEPHLLSLALLADGAVVVGTSDKAKLYRVDGPGKATTLHDFGRTEVRAIAVSAEQAIYAIANDIKTTGAVTSARASGGENSSGSSSTSTASKVKGRGQLLRVGSDGAVEILLEDDSEHFTSLGLGRDNLPYVGTGVEGRVYTVNQQRQSVLVADIEARQISAMLLTSPISAIVSSDASGVHLILGQGGKQSIWTSKVLDAAIRANFGRLEWESTGPIEVMARSGNTKEPDDTWTAWSAPLKTKGRAGVAPGRYLQVRARFALDPTAALTRLEIPFVTDNQRAVVTKLDVGGVTTDRSLGDGVVASGGPVTGRNSPELSLDWSVDNPDKDTLRYRLYYRLIGMGDWYELLPPDEILTKTNYKWDTASLPEGRYRLKVTVSDEPSNPPDRVTHHEFESGLVTVDNTPPALLDLALVGGKLRGRAVDGVGPIARIEVSVAGTNDWVPLVPVDSIFDESAEVFDADIAGWLPPGRKMIAVRAYDYANNYVVRHVIPTP